MRPARLMTDYFFRASGFCLIATAILVAIPFILIFIDVHENGWTSELSLTYSVGIFLGPVFLWIFIPMQALFNLAMHLSRIAPFIFLSKGLLIIEIGLYIAGWYILNNIKALDHFINYHLCKSYLMLLATPFLFILVIAILIRLCLPLQCRRKLRILTLRQQQYYKSNPQYMSQTADIAVCVIIPILILLVPILADIFIL